MRHFLYGCLVIAATISCTGQVANPVLPGAGLSAAKSSARVAQAPQVLVYQGKIFGAPISISMSTQYAGAIYSLVFRGQEYIDTYDHGRQLQSASSFDGYGECYNPTEAGTRDDFRELTSSSVLKSWSVIGNTIETENDSAFWLAPGYEYGRTCGASTVTRAINTSVTGGYLFKKVVKVGFRGLENVLDYNVDFYVPQNHKSFSIEALTGYMPPDFSRAFRFLPKLDRIEEVGFYPAEERSVPLIMTTADGKHAMGIYAPAVPETHGPNFIGFEFKSEFVNKWSIVYRKGGDMTTGAVAKGHYRFRTFVVLGSKDEVVAALRKLVCLEPSTNLELAPSVCTQARAEIPVACRVIGDDFAKKNDYYATRNPDVRAVYGVDEILKHFCEFGKYEGRLNCYSETDCISRVLRPPPSPCVGISGNNAKEDQYYADNNPDVRAVYPVSQIMKHFCQFGKSEHRLHCYADDECSAREPEPPADPCVGVRGDDPKEDQFYATTNPDVAAVYPASQVYRHYCQFGMGEKRQNCYEANECTTRF